MLPTRVMAWFAVTSSAVQTPPPPVYDLTTDVIRTWMDPAFYAGAAYCSAETIRNWTCGYSCSTIKDPEIITTGGNNAAVPNYFVANNGTDVIIAIAGTNPWSILSVADDFDFHLVKVDTTYFPDSTGVMVHHGFYRSFEAMVEPIQAAVFSQLARGFRNVVITGHSLGGALATITAVYLQKRNPRATVSCRAFGMPRLGNPAWADYVDATLGANAQHLNNFIDVVPQLPSRNFGYQQSSNEIWIADDHGKEYRACAGQENKNCQDGLGLKGYIRNFIKYLSVTDHLGPYAGVWITETNCKEKI